MISETNIETMDQKRAELVTQLLTAIEDRKLNSLATNSGELVYQDHRSSNGTYSTLHFEGSGDLNSNIGQEGDGYYVYGDFNCWSSSPTVDEVIEFFDAWDDIALAFKEFDAKIEQAVNKTFQTI